MNYFLRDDLQRIMMLTMFFRGELLCVKLLMLKLATDGLKLQI